MRAIGITTTHVAEELSQADAIIGRLGELVVTAPRAEMEKASPSNTIGGGPSNTIGVGPDRLLVEI